MKRDLMRRNKLYGSITLTPLEKTLAEKRRELEERYGNPDNNSCFYKCPVTQETVPLTPAMMSEWARAIVDKKTTVDKPPNSLTFDPATRRSSLLSHRRRSSSISGSDSGSRGPSDIACMSNIIDRLLTPQKETPPPLTLPSLPIEEQNTPTKLPRFLTFARDRLGIANATHYEDRLRDKSYGPDILHLVEEKDLAVLGIPAGDIIRMKQAAPKWMSSDDAKRKDAPHDDGAGAGLGFGEDAHRDKQARTIITFEKRYRDGSGASRVYGHMEPADPFEGTMDNVFEWFYRCELTQTFIAIPIGFRAIIEEEE
ncbi:hypothetical protein VKT23_014190 [Stygiomarasmius scandens]|uniref:SAM domain-containing protein n=1 Tax=Marasmiellus scandens TaxID=2682957 RepID=A0ABR1J126_9AGAR